MNWHSWADFWAMGGHGFFVWGAMAATVVLLAGEWLGLTARQRALRREPGDGWEHHDEA